MTRLLRAEALRQSEANYRALFELNPAPMWICDENTLEFLDVNEAAQKLYGWPRNEFLRMTAKDIRPPEDRAGISPPGEAAARLTGGLRR